MKTESDMKILKTYFAFLFAGMLALAACDISRDLYGIIGSWETTTYVFDVTDYTNTIPTTNFISNVPASEAMPETYVYTFEKGSTGTKVTLTNGAVKKTETVTWVLNEIDKVLTVTLGTTNEHIGYTMGSNSFSITSMTVTYGGTTNDRFYATTNYSGVGGTDWEIMALDAVECYAPTN